MGGRTAHALDERGTVRDWLVTVPWAEPVTDLDRHLDADGDPFGPRGRWVLENAPDASPLKAALYADHLIPEEPPPTPVEGAALTWSGRQGRWLRLHTECDGLVDFSAFCFTPQYRLALAGVLLEVDQADQRVLRVASTGPTAVFVGARLVDRDDTVTYMEPAERRILVQLPSGTTPVVIASWHVAFREVRQVVRLRVQGLPVRVVLLSPDADEQSAALAEQVLADVGFLRWGSEAPVAPLSVPRGVDLLVNTPAGEQRVSAADGFGEIALAGPTTHRPEEPLTASMLATGEQLVSVSVPGTAGSRQAPVLVLPGGYAGVPAGTPAQWRREHLEEAAVGGGSVAAALARLAIDRPAIDRRDLHGALDMVRSCADCADFEVVALLNLWHRAPLDAWPEGLRGELAEAITGFRYWLDQPGIDCMCFFTENHQLVFHAAEMLAGEAFGNAVFANTGWSGERHAAHGAALCRDWIRRRIRGGLSEFDSNAYLAIDVLALTSLVEHSRDAELRDMATAMIDKLLFSLAVNSWHGIHASSHGRAYAHTLRSARLEETSPLQRLLWGMGCRNDALLPSIVMATAVRYQLPETIRAAALHVPEEWWGVQRYRGAYRRDRDLLERPWEAVSVMWRTPDVALASVQDYRPGLPGLQEHVWGATLGPEAHVFANHPANAATHSAARPNFWAGNRILPRAAQEGGAVLAVYRIPPDDPMGFTHAWFPTPHLAEWCARGSWIAARVGDGYVALATDGGSRLLERGPTAGQELRPVGAGTACICQVGRRATHGSFTEFVDALREPDFASRVRHVTPEGHELELGFEGTFRVDGHPRILDAAHVHNPFTHTPLNAGHMTIAVGDHHHSLDLAHPRRFLSG